MKIAFVLYKIASWSMILVGVGHTLTDLTASKSTSQLEMIQTMKNFKLEMLGTKTDIFSFHQGFSLMMGLLLFGYGVINLLILKNNQNLKLPSNILIVNMFITLTCLLLSICYFFVVPILLTGISFLGFLSSFIITNFKTV